jgi:hypothetical protein
MKHQATLLLRRFGLDKSHVGSGDSLANRLSVSGIVLLSLNVGFDVVPLPRGVSSIRRKIFSNRLTCSFVCFSCSLNICQIFRLGGLSHLGEGAQDFLFGKVEVPEAIVKKFIELLRTDRSKVGRIGGN